MPGIKAAPDAPGGRVYDVAVIGAGVVGLSIARELSKYKLSVVVLEKEPDVGWGASKGNAGVVHAFQLPLGSLKGKLCLEGNKMYDELAEELDVPLRRVGLLLVSLNLLESLVLLFTYAYFKLKGVEVKWVGGKRLREMEPGVSGKARMALLFPTAGVTSPLELVVALAESASQNGVEFLFEAEVERVEFEGDLARVVTSKGDVLARWVINAAGLYADVVAERSGAGGLGSS